MQTEDKEWNNSEKCGCSENNIDNSYDRKNSRHYSVELRNVLTGFKFIGEQIGKLETNNEEYRYIFEFEDSYGYLSGIFVRDKDAVNDSLLICEIFSYYKSNRQSLIDVLDNLYKKYGYYQSALKSYTFEGVKGFNKIQDLMNSLRNKTPREIAGIDVIGFADYQKSILQMNGEHKIYLPKSDVLQYYLNGDAGDAQVVVRPLGTDPKIKIYVSTCKQTKQQCEKSISLILEYFKKLIK